MAIQRFRSTHQSTGFHLDAAFSDLEKWAPLQKTVFITDENIYAAHPKKFKGRTNIVLKAGEAFKVQATVDTVVEELIALKADRKTWLVGVGGGVVTDITGYVASVFLRGVSFGFIPTTLLAMVDAAIGGKNGIDVGMYKNMVGTVNQPRFLLYDISLLKTLPDAEWRNGFAEIIKHAAMKDATMFKELEEKSIGYFQKNKAALQKLVRRNATIKAKVVQQDEFEQHQRRLLNFGHTLGHAVEKQNNLMHGEAVAIGMVFAAHLSHQLLGFRHTSRLINLIGRYKLPATSAYDKPAVFNVLTGDKKREGAEVNFVLLEKIGKAVIQKIPLEKLQSLI